ncbi:hypothetical protein [Halorubrum ruber]|uniref:Uncharacterized protein n=1 Tax=Halorubrum ruber TaxID=2982524 RepID=A0A8T8LJJ9_9EURY|nr:hypothetical protein [Halorubrum ruber]QUO47207.1 hypothetical protein J7656_11540 [Halorubrum ruber]
MADGISDWARSRLWRTKYWWERLLIWVGGAIASAALLWFVGQALWSYAETVIQNGSFILQTFISNLWTNITSGLTGESGAINLINIVFVTAIVTFLGFVQKFRNTDSLWGYWGVVLIIAAFGLFRLNIQILSGSRMNTLVILIVGLAGIGLLYDQTGLFGD